MIRWLVLFALFSAMSCAQDFAKLVDRFFEEYYFASQPTQGTAAGFHEYDSKLEDYSRGNVERAVRTLRQFERDFEALDAARLTAVARGDRELVLARIRADLLELETVRGWEKNPDRYSGGVTNSVFVVMIRKFAPADVRLRAVIAREKQIPAVFAAARANLNNPPRIFTEVAIEQLPGIVSFFQSDVPAAFKDVQDAQLLLEFKQSNQAAIAAIQDYGKFLREDLLPRSRGDFRIGAETYRQKLLYEEMIDKPLDELLTEGYADLRRNQAAFREAARKFDASQTPEMVLKALESDYPRPEKLLDEVRGVLGGLRDFIEKHHIVTIPSKIAPIVEETPPFMRALTFASMETPGPFEKVATEAFYNITLPEKSWKPEQTAEHMAAFTHGVIGAMSIHEAYPGHYVQFLWVQRAPSKVRKLLGCSSNSEGWAHYSEQMMLEQGYGAGDLKLRMSQLTEALLRNARYIVGIEMHTGRMTFDQAVDFFVKEGFQTRANGLRETKRGASDPTYLVYTLGKLDILKLREAYRKKRGAEFRLQEFHDRFLSQGFPPIRLIREALGL